jgi:hypothetical protein
MVERLARAWIATALVLLLLVAACNLVFHRNAGITDLFFRAQDLPVLAATGLAAGVLWISKGFGSRWWSQLADRAQAAASIQTRSIPAALTVAATAVVTAVISWVGVGLVFENYPLSMDEFMATFDAAIIGHGQAMALIAPPWRSFAPALETMFMLPIPGHAFWVSAYLPVNATLRALAGTVGAERLLNPLLAAFSVIAVFAVGRRLWPLRPDLAVVAAVLLATSSQFLLTAMTPYAMTAHLALNLAWLWLFLRGGVVGHSLAIAVGALACGLHQLVFHPLFVAPFVLQLWLERRWRLAGLYTAAYAVICGFWVLYWPLALAFSGLSGPHGSALGAQWLTSRVVELLTAFDLANLGLMAKNLIRFVTWQNPLAICLAVVSLGPSLRAGPTLRSLALGLLLTTTAVFVLLAYQGHGWGYRYVHGLLGSLCLMAAFAWGRLTEGFDPRRRAVAHAAFMGVAAASVLLLMPLRAWQAHRFLHPYAAAEAAVRRAPSQIVLVDDSGIAFGQDLVRNDPYLRNRPLILNLGSLDSDQLEELCARYTVSVFDRAGAARLGVPTFEPPAESDAAQARADLDDLKCASPAMAR